MLNLNELDLIFPRSDAEEMYRGLSSGQVSPTGETGRIIELIRTLNWTVCLEGLKRTNVYNGISSKTDGRRASTDGRYEMLVNAFNKKIPPLGIATQSRVSSWADTLSAKEFAGVADIPKRMERRSGSRIRPARFTLGFGIQDINLGGSRDEADEDKRRRRLVLTSGAKR